MGQQGIDSSCQIRSNSNDGGRCQDGRSRSSKFGDSREAKRIVPELPAGFDGPLIARSFTLEIQLAGYPANCRMPRQKGLDESLDQ